MTQNQKRVFESAGLMTRVAVTVANAFMIALALATPSAAQPRASQPCATPRSAAANWLDHLQPDRYRPKQAIACFDWDGAGMKGPERVDAAKQLLTVLDTRGLLVVINDLPDEASADGADQVYLFPATEYVEGERRVDVTSPADMPELYLERKGGRWVFSASSVNAIEPLHDSTVVVDLGSFVDSLPPWLTRPVLFGVGWWQIIGFLLVLLAGLLLRSLVAWIVRNWIGRLIARARERVGKVFVSKLAAPVGTLALAGWLGYALPLLQFSVRVNRFLFIGVRILAAIALVIVLYRLTDLLADVFARRAEGTDTKLDDQLVPLLRRTAKVFVVILGGLFVLQNMDVDITSLLAVGTVGTLALSLAAKDTASNFFGSVSIFADRPFQVGDWVVIGDIEGVVEEVGMRSSRIRTFKNSLVTMPNSIITVTPVDNFGVRQFRRTNATLGLRYDTSAEQIEAFCDGVRAILQANPAVRKDAYEVHFTAFGSHSLDVLLYFFFEVNSWSEELRQRHLVYLEILRLADDLKVGFAFPTQSLLLEQVAEAEKLAAGKTPELKELRERLESYGPGGSRSRPGGPEVSGGFFPTGSD